jgi:NAD(P)-dependent dehydrogenase (short-subunit alcohol dehydrogenase family)
MNSFTDKVAVVTGAGSGLGRAITVELADAGATVVAVDIDVEGLARTSDISAGDGGRCLVKCADVSLRAEMERLAEEVLSELGRVPGSASVGSSLPYPSRTSSGSWASISWEKSTGHASSFHR